MRKLLLLWMAVIVLVVCSGLSYGEVTAQSVCTSQPAADIAGSASGLLGTGYTASASATSASAYGDLKAQAGWVEVSPGTLENTELNLKALAGAGGLVIGPLEQREGSPAAVNIPLDSIIVIEGNTLSYESTSRNGRSGTMTLETSVSAASTETPTGFVGPQTKEDTELLKKVNKYKDDPTELSKRLTQEEINRLISPQNNNFGLSEQQIDVVDTYKKTPQLISIQEKIKKGEYAKLTDEEMKIASDHANLLGSLLNMKSTDISASVTQISALRAEVRGTIADQRKLDSMTPAELDELATKAKDGGIYGGGATGGVFGGRGLGYKIVAAKANIYRREFADSWWPSLNPGWGSRAVQDQFNKWAGHDVGYDIMESDSEFLRNFVGFAMSGYEYAICESLFKKKLAGPVFQDYPGHYATGAEFPEMGSMIVLLGRLTEYANANWSSGDKWFPEIKPDGTIAPKGYLYKISWAFTNPYRQAEIDVMTDYEKQDKGILENGTIEYKIKLIQEDNTETELTADFAQSRNITWNELKLLGPLQTDSRTYSFYDMARYKTIKIEFQNGYRYDNVHGDYRKDFVVTSLSSLIPQNFEFFPS